MRFGLALDHLAVVAKTVEEGAAFVEAVLGVQPTRGGRHPEMGTHNQLMSQDSLYRRLYKLQFARD